MNQDAFFGNLYDLFKSNESEGPISPSLSPNASNIPIPITQDPFHSNQVAWQISSPKTSELTNITDTYQPSSVFSYSDQTGSKDRSSILSDNRMGIFEKLNCLSSLEKAFCGVACGASVFIIILVVALLISTFLHNKKVKETERENDDN